MSNNHLIIGLGGTGGKTIKNLRIAINEEFRCNDPVLEPKINVKYLYIDSQESGLDESETLWKTPSGSDISLNKESILRISENNLEVRMNNPQHYPTTHKYLSNKENWSEAFDPSKLEAAGGQKRRLGVALFEPECRNFVDQVSKLVSELETTISGKKGVQFHVCAGLAGGTGSGTFLHVIAQLRAKFDEPKKYPIFLYILLPEENATWASNGEQTNYYANGYAALLELNAYMVTKPNGEPRFTPIDLRGSEHSLSNLRSPLQGCFILDNVNEQGHMVDVEEVTQLIAQLLYQRMFLLNDSSLPQEVNKAITFENEDMIDESDGSNQGNKSRSVRCQTFGVKKIVIPDEEIREYLAACFAEQSILQMLNNNWNTDTKCYHQVNKPTDFSATGYVQKESNRRSWKLALNQIKLSEGLLENETKENWKNIKDEWLDIANEVKNKAWVMPPEENGLDGRLEVLENSFKDHYGKTFRGSGVVGFYESKQNDLGRENTHVTEIVNAMQSSMFKLWQDGDLGFYELQTMLDNLIYDTQKRINTINERLVTLEKERKDSSNLIQKNKNSWKNVGILGKLSGKKVELFEEQVKLLGQLYEKKTDDQALRFAQKLLEICLVKFRDNVKEDIAKLISFINKEKNAFEKLSKEKCSIQEGSDKEKPLIEFYDPNKIREICGELLEVEKEQKTWAQRSRNEYVVSAQTNNRIKRGKEKYFSELLEHGDLKNSLEKVARNNSEEAHNELGNHKHLINLNIVSKFQEHFDDKGLSDYIYKIMKSAQVYMRFNTVEFQDKPPKAVMAVILPKCDDKPFREKLAKLFVANQSNGLVVKVVESSLNKNQISLVSIKYYFPLRHLQPVKFLKGKYDLRLQKNPANAKLEVHIEDHFADRLPDLFLPTLEQMGDRILPWYQLAICLDLFELIHIDETNKNVWNIEYIVPDEKGKVRLPEKDGKQVDKDTEPYPYELVSFLVESIDGNSFTNAELQEVLENSTEDEIFFLQKTVNQNLESETYKRAIKRDALKEKLVAQKNLVLSKRNKNSKDAFYMKLEESTKTAIAMIDGLI